MTLAELTTQIALASEPGRALASKMEDILAGFVFTAALFGLRKRTDKAPEEWKLLWAFWAQIGSPPLPCTAPWLEKKDLQK